MAAEAGAGGGAGRAREGEGPILWLAFEVDAEGRVEALVTRAGAGGPARERERHASIPEAAEAYGGSFREVVENVLDSGSRKGRWRP